MNKSLVVTHDLENWGYGSARGYVESNSNIIHILSGEAQEKLTLIHENYHLERRGTLFSQLYILSLQPAVFRLFIGLVFILAVPSFLWGLYWLPAVVAGGYLFMLLCGQIEELIVDYLTNKQVKELQKHA